MGFPADDAYGVKRNASIWGLAAVLALVIAEAVVFSWGGWEHGDVAFQSVSRSCVGCITLGTKQFWADSGDALEMSYDVDLRRGSVYVFILRMTPGHLGDTEGRMSITQSGPGTWRAPISRPGFYHMVFDGMPGGHGYEFKYSVSWKIRRATPWFTSLATVLGG
jgi:hypothetical protein